MRALALLAIASTSACSLADAAFGESSTGDFFCSENLCWYEEEFEFADLGNTEYLGISNLDSDGVPDILAARSDGTIHALFAEADTFAQPQRFNEFGDDEVRDIATLHEWQFAADTSPLLALSRSNEITIRDAGGTIFNITMPDGPGPVAIGDYDGDGNADVAVGLGNGEISILLQAAGFQPAAVRLAPSSGSGGVRALVAGRFQSPGGCHDLGATQGDDVTKATIFSCRSSGTLLSDQTSFEEQEFTVTIGAGPLTGGGDDFVFGVGCMANCEDYDLLRIHDGQGDYQSSFVHGSVTSGTFELADLVVGDFNRQGGADAIMVGDGHGTAPNLIMGFDGNFTDSGTGFETLEGVFVDGSVSSVAVGDLNNDRRQDFVIGHPDARLRVLLSYSK
jgi:hypothetical protein